MADTDQNPAPAEVSTAEHDPEAAQTMAAEVPEGGVRQFGASSRNGDTDHWSPFVESPPLGDATEPPGQWAEPCMAVRTAVREPGMHGHNVFQNAGLGTEAAGDVYLAHLDATTAEEWALEQAHYEALRENAYRAEFGGAPEYPLAVSDWDDPTALNADGEDPALQRWQAVAAGAVEPSGQWSEDGGFWDVQDSEAKQWLVRNDEEAAAGGLGLSLPPDASEDGGGETSVGEWEWSAMHWQPPFDDAGTLTVENQDLEGAAADWKDFQAFMHGDLADFTVAADNAEDGA